MAIENEVRFLVTKMNLRAIWGLPGWHIRQGYFDLLNPNKHLRVRIINDERAFLGTKEGTGHSRQEEEMPIDIEAANFLFKQCSSFIEKTRIFPRYHVQGGTWTIDFFKKPLEGLKIAEFEHHMERDKVKLPSWIQEAKDITDSISNVHLARLATELRETGQTKTPLTLYNEMAVKIPKIVITGGPCSGKTKVLKVVKEKMGNLVHCVPEVASIMISQVGIKPRTNPRRFNSSLYRIQSIFEATSAGQAADENKKGMVLDRGSLDLAAYMKKRLTDFVSLLKTSISYEHSKYQAVICLEVPTKHIYEQHKNNNPARTETYEQAVLLGNKIIEAWQGYPNLFFISRDMSWQEKEDLVLHIIRKAIS